MVSSRTMPDCASAGDRPRHEPGEHVGPVPASRPACRSPYTWCIVHTNHRRRCGCRLRFSQYWRRSADLLVSVQRSLAGEHVGGRMNIVNWLDPIIWNPVTGEFGGTAVRNRRNGGKLSTAQAGHASETGETTRAKAEHATRDSTWPTQYEAVGTSQRQPNGFSFSFPCGRWHGHWIGISILRAKTLVCRTSGQLDWARSIAPATTNTGSTNFMVGPSRAARWMLARAVYYLRFKSDRWRHVNGTAWFTRLASR